VTRSVDYTALLMPVSRADIAAFKAELKASSRSRWYTAMLPTVFGVVVLVLIGIILLFVVGGFANQAISHVAQDPSPGTIGGLVLGLLGAAIPFLAIALVVRSLLGGKSWERWLRLTRFASANSLEFTPQFGNPALPGAIFSQGHGRQSINRLTSTAGRYLEIGNYRYKTGNGKEERTHDWGYLALRLDRALPHMVLDSRANNGLFGSSNLPAAFAKDQVLSLEGDFDSYFTLYCPRAYERDALYVFTPDLMALLIDNAAPFDVEIVDDWMFVYSARPFVSVDPALYQRLFHIVDTVGEKTVNQSDRYVDDKIGERIDPRTGQLAPSIIAPQGKRLRRGTSIGAIIIIAVVGGFVLLPQLLGMIGMVGR